MSSIRVGGGLAALRSAVLLEVSSCVCGRRVAGTAGWGRLRTGQPEEEEGGPLPTAAAAAAGDGWVGGR